MRIVLTNLPRGRGADLARTLVERRLAACVNVLPARSIYRWEGELCDDEEDTLLIKTSAQRVAELVAQLQALHPYSLPEILVLDIDSAASLPDYVAWVRSETR